MIAQTTEFFVSFIHSLLIFASLYSGLDATHFAVDISLDLSVSYFTISCVKIFHHRLASFILAWELEISELFTFVVIKGTKVPQCVVNRLTCFVQFFGICLLQKVSRYS